MKILLDTNAYSRLFSGDTEVLKAVGDAETVYLSVFVIGKLLAGFRKGSNEKRNRELLSTFLRKPTVKIVSAMMETSEIFAIVKTQLQKAGTPIPINDVWIAAHAMQTGAFLVTGDRHFQNVSGLLVWNSAI